MSEEDAFCDVLESFAITKVGGDYDRSPQGSIIPANSFSQATETQEDTKEANDEESTIVYLKTKKKSYKQYKMSLMGIDLFFYKNKSEIHEFMHSLKGAYIKSRESEEIDEATGKIGFPVKMVLSKKRARILYFDTAQEKERWMILLKDASGCCDILDYYKF